MLAFLSIIILKIPISLFIDQLKSNSNINNKVELVLKYMIIPKLKIGSITADIPIIQGGMGVKVSLSSLASSVANEGGIGTLSSIGLGARYADQKTMERTCVEELIKVIRKTKSMTNGAERLAVNFMGVYSLTDEMVKVCVDEGIKNLVYGAGLPMKLPGLVEDPEVNLIPIISSARVAQLILRTWDKRYKRIPAAFILEGPLAGGHLGFSREQLEHVEDFTVESILMEVLACIEPFEEEYGKKIPVITAGGIFDGKDIAKMISLGASGVQMATRFVCTYECDVSPEFKQKYIDAKKEDIVIINSPVGLPGRAIRNKFLVSLEVEGKKKIYCPYLCLTACKVKTAQYCIAKVLLDSAEGDVENGLVFCGQNAYRIDKIISVKALISELLEEVKQY